MHHHSWPLFLRPGRTTNSSTAGGKVLLLLTSAAAGQGQSRAKLKGFQYERPRPVQEPFKLCMLGGGGADGSNKHFVGHLVGATPARCVQELLPYVSIHGSLWSWGQPMNKEEDIKWNVYCQADRGREDSSALSGKTASAPHMVDQFNSNGIMY